MVVKYKRNTYNICQQTREATESKDDLYPIGLYMNDGGYESSAIHDMAKTGEPSLLYQRFLPPSLIFRKTHELFEKEVFVNLAKKYQILPKTINLHV